MTPKAVLLVGCMMRVSPYMSTLGSNSLANFIKHTYLTVFIALGSCLQLVCSPQPASDGCIPVRGTRQADLSSLKCFRGILPLFQHQRACCLLFGTSIMVFLVMWSLQKNSRAATEAQRTWRPFLTDVFRLCCCSLSRFRGTEPERWFMMWAFSLLQSADTNCAPGWE